MRSRLRRRLFESLEQRCLLAASITGSVFEDLNRDGVEDVEDLGAPRQRVYLDLDQDGTLSTIASGVEPDDVAAGESLRNADPSVVLRIDSNGADVVALDDPRASTGDRVFGRGEGPTFPESHKLRIAFNSPVQFVAIDFVGADPGQSSSGVFEIFDAQDNLLETRGTGALADGQVASLNVFRSDGDIAYALAHTNSGDGRFDRLTFTGLEPHRDTAADGDYVFGELPNGQYTVALNAAPGVDQTSPATSASDTRFWDFPDRTDMAFDPIGGVVYATNHQGQVRRFDVERDAELEAFEVGLELDAIDVSPGGDFLYVGEAANGMRGSLVRKVDARTGEVVANIAVGDNAFESVHDIRLLANGKAWITTEFAGSGWVPLRELDLATDEIVIKPVPPGSGLNDDIREQTWIYATPDRDRVLATEGNISIARMFTYDAKSDAFDAQGDIVTFLDNKPGAISPDGSLIAIGGVNGVTIFDADFQLVAEDLPAFGVGLAFDPGRPFLYVLDLDDDSLVTIHTDTFEEVSRTPIGEDLGAGRRFEMAIAPGGDWLFFETPTGIRMVALREAVSPQVLLENDGSAEVRFGVRATAMLPSAVHDQFKIATDADSQMLPVLDNDVAPIGDAPTIEIVSPPDSGGSAEVVNNRVSYTPQAGFEGVERFVYRITQGGQSDEATVALTVTARDGSGQVAGRVIDDATGEGIPFTEVFVDLNGNGSWSSDEPTTLTDANGAYVFRGLEPGRYHILQVIEPGYEWLSPTGPGAANVLAELENIGGFVYDDTRGVLYVSTTDGLLRTYDPESEAFLPGPIALGGELGRLAIAPDDSALIVTDLTTDDTHGFLHHINLDDGTVTTLEYERQSLETGSYDVAFTSNQSALFTTRFAGSGNIPLREIDTTDLTIRTRDDAPGFGMVRQDTLIFADPSGDRLFFAQANSSEGPTLIYEAGDDAFIQANTWTFLGGANGAVATRDDHLALSRLNTALTVFDVNTLLTVELLPRLGGGVIYDATRPVMFAVDAQNDQVVAYGAPDYQELYRIDINEDVVVGQQEIALSEDGRTLFIATPSGFRHFEVNRPAPFVVDVMADMVVEHADFLNLAIGNRRPFSSDLQFELNEDSVLDQPAPGVLIDAQDPDDDPLTAELLDDVQHGDLTLFADGGFTYTPAPDYFGDDAFRFRAFDGGLYSRPVRVQLAVTPVADAPAAQNDLYATDEDTPLVVAAGIGLLANDADADGDALEIESFEPPASGTLELADDGSFVFTPAEHFFGEVTFTYRATDGALLSNEATVTIDVAPVNDAPLASDDAYEVSEDGVLEVPASGVLSNDSDADDDPLTAVLVDVPQHGELTLNPDGGFTYTPDADYAGDDSFTYRASDGELESGLASVSLTISPVADAPLASDDAYEVSEDGVLEVPASGVLSNDSDADDDPLTAVLADEPQHGELTLNPDGGFTYTPDPDYAGDDSFTYRASDGELESELASVVLTINPVADAPLATDDEFSGIEDQPVVVDAPGVLVNDSDADGDALRAVLVDAPDVGELQWNEDGGFRYDPAPDFHGRLEFTYRAADADSESNLATVVLDIAPQNDPPLAAPDGFELAEDQQLLVNAPGVLGNDGDPDGDLLILQAILEEGPTHGELEFADDGGFTYTPNPDFAGEDEFRYRASDGELVSEPAIVTLTVTPINDRPVAVDDAFTTNEDEPLELAAPGVLGNDSDVDNDPLQTVLVDGPSLGTLELNPDGSLLYTPDPDANGIDSFTYMATDGDLDSEVRTVELTVTAVNDAPVVSDPTGELVQHRWRAVEMTVADSDIGDNELQWTLRVSDGLVRVREDVENGVVASQITGQSTDEVVVVAPIAAVQATLAANDGVQAYTSHSEPLTFTAIADDQGTAGAGAGVTEVNREFVPTQNDFPWSNLSGRFDVDDDGDVIPRDVLEILSDIIRNGSRSLPTPGPEGPYAFLDVFLDNRVTPQDLVLVLNEILRLNGGEGAADLPTAVPVEPESPPTTWDALAASPTFWRELSQTAPAALPAPPQSRDLATLAAWLRDHVGEQTLEEWLAERADGLG